MFDQTHAAPEIAVASTEAFSVQCSGFYLIALKLAELSGKFTEAELSEYCKKFEEAIATVPGKS